MTAPTIRPTAPRGDARAVAGRGPTPPPDGQSHPGRGTGTAPRRGYTPTRVGAYAGIRAIQRAEG
jgi:hypothetical protein